MLVLYTHHIQTAVPTSSRSRPGLVPSPCNLSPHPYGAPEGESVLVGAASLVESWPPHGNGVGSPWLAVSS